MIAAMDIRAQTDAYNTHSESESWEQLCDPGLGFSRDDFFSVLALWNSQAASRPLPLRSDMTARVLKPFLPNVALKERVETSPSRYRWRIVGTRVAQVLGERTGKFTDEGAPPKVAARWNASCDLVLASGKPLRFVGRVLVEGKDFLASELMFMPLAGDDGQPRFIMGFGHYNADRGWRELFRAASAAAASVAAA
jgi:hypothetical protein